MSRWPAVDAFLEDEGLGTTTDELLADADVQRLSALCYIVHEGRALMLRRERPPFVDHWTAPGGKLHRTEDPVTAIRREVREETGLALKEPRLRLIASETGPEHYNWLLFFFRACPVTDDVKTSMLHGKRRCGEGLLDWVPVRELAERRLPGVERMLLPHIFADTNERYAEAKSDQNDGNGPYFARIRFDDEYEVADIDVRLLHGEQA